MVTLISAGYTGGRYTVHAQQRVPTYTIPKSWGHCVGVMAGLLFLEDSNGAIRLAASSSGQLQMQENRN
jgi:hypothetical protein